MAVSERFDDRYDTEVDGSHMVVTQSIDENVNRAGNRGGWLV